MTMTPERVNKIRKEESPHHLERKETPLVKFEIFYSPHVTGKDFEELHDLIKDADVYVPESPAITEMGRTFYRAVVEKGFNEAFADKTIRIDPFVEVELKLLSKSGKVILFADTPPGHYTEDKFGRNEGNKLFVYADFQAGHFREAIRGIKEVEKAYAKNEHDREEYIRKEIFSQIEELRRGGVFKEDQAIRVLIRMGAFHTDLARKLEDNARGRVKRAFSSSPFIFTHDTELPRAYYLGKTEVSDDLAARALMSEFVTILVLGVSEHTAKLYPVIRKIVDSLSYEQIEEISKKKILEGEMGVWKQNLRAYLQSLGIEVPVNESDVDEMLKGDVRYKFLVEKRKE